MKKISAAIFSVVMFLSSTMNVSANIQPGEIVDNGNFGIDWSLTNDGTLVLEEGHLEVSDNETYPWSRYSNDIEKITINGEIVLPEQPFLFKGLKHLEAIENIDRINTTNVKDMSYMFYQAESLESLNLSTWDITNVTNMDNMFDGAINLEYLDLSNWDISNVETMDNFLNDEMNIETVDLQNWDENNKGKIESLFEKDDLESEPVLFSLTDSNSSTAEITDGDMATAKTEVIEEEIIIEKTVLDGWQLENNEWSYYVENKKTVGWIELNGQWYYLDSNGVMATGWEKLNNKWYYMDSEGRMTTGWEKVNNRWYYMKSDGAMATGWIKTNNKWYYLNSSGAMETGWKKIDSQWYYLKTDGAMVTNSYMINNKSNIFSDNGAWMGHWEENNTGWLFVFPNNQYPVNQWEKLNNRWYYFDNEGYMVTGWKLINNHWYYTNYNGEMQTGWIELHGEWYYLDDSGAMQTGWIDLNGKLYFLDANGKWLPEGRRIVYLDPGHGSGDTGAYYGGIAERDINLEVSNKIARGLRELGYEVIMSRTTRENSFSTNSRDDLFARAADANKVGADIFVSVHHNALPGNTSVSGIETFYYGVNPDYPPLPENLNSHNDPTRINNSKKLATLIHNELIDSTKVYDRGVKTGAFVITRETNMPTALLELGFMSNAAELKKLTTNSYQEILANSVVDGIHKYFNN